MILNSDFGKRRVVIYARVSTEHEAQISALENQLDWYKPILAARPEWELVGQYIDEGITGTSAEKRPQFMKMIRDAKQKKFDMIITREVSRFARNTVDTLKYTRELKDKGVEVYFLNDNIKTFDGDGELRLTIMATLAQDESRKTSVRVKSGQLTSMQNGTFYGNGNILGYRRHQTIIDGGKKQVDFLIDPEQAETVRLMFDMYLNGCGLMQIKNELERRGRKTAMGKDTWHVTNISHVLQNTFYCGIITYRKEYVPDYLTQKKIRNHGEIEKLQVKGKHEPIITVEDFERVQAIMESKRNENPSIKTGKRIGKNPRTVVWGKLLICECGHRFSLRRWKPGDGPEGGAYLCYSIVHNGSYESRKRRGLSTEGYCKTPMVPLWKLQMMAKYIFRNYLSQKDKVLELANSILEAHITDTEESVDNSAQIEDYKRELERVSRRIDNLIEMRSDGEIDKADFIKRKTEAEQKHMELQNKIAELEAEQNKTTPVIDYKEKLEVLRYALEQYTDFDADGDIPDSVVEAFVEKIVVSKDGYDWYLRFDGDPNDPLHLKTEGKRRKNTAIIDPNKQTACEPVRDTGCFKITNPLGEIRRDFFYWLQIFRFLVIIMARGDRMAFLQMDFLSHALGQAVCVNIILPEKREQEGFKTLWLLHGLSDDHTAWMRYTSIERYARDYGIGVVMPCVDRSWYTDTAYGKQYFTFLTKELPEMMAYYFKGYSPAREDNFIMGNSMGGYGALKAALTYPEQYGFCASFSGSVDITRKNLSYHLEEWRSIFGFDLESASQLEGTKHDVFALAKEVKDFPYLYMWCGSEDRLLEGNRQFAALLSQRNVPHTFIISEGHHTWDCWDVQLQNALAFWREQTKNN